jgi:hypothetical protein
MQSRSSVSSARLRNSRNLHRCSRLPCTMTTVERIKYIRDRDRIICRGSVAHNRTSERPRQSRAEQSREVRIQRELGFYVKRGIALISPLSQSSAFRKYLSHRYSAQIWIWRYFNGSRSPNTLHQTHTRKPQADPGKPAKKSPAGLTSTGLRRR